MTTAQLSAENLSAPGTLPQCSGVSSSLNTKSGINWTLVAAAAGGIIILILFVWQIANRRGRANPPGIHHAGAKSQYRSKFCPNCGNPAAKNDRFCSSCGTALHGE
ncbi:MAG: zinc ribbon domain-containing protein [Deltaproteobacteria bacterium]|nr:MAG: zinc ribbon domain-containing protein [Deltaproteobacteria bacterium]